MGIWTVLRCHFVPNLEIVTSIGGELWHGQAQNGVNFEFGVQFDLEGHDQLSHKTIGFLTKVFYIWSKFGDPSLKELSRGQTWWRTDWRTDGQTQATTIPEGQNWPRVKKRKNPTPTDHGHYQNWGSGTVDTSLLAHLPPRIPNGKIMHDNLKCYFVNERIDYLEEYRVWNMTTFITTLTWQL